MQASVRIHQRKEAPILTTMDVPLSQSPGSVALLEYTPDVLLNWYTYQFWGFSRTITMIIRKVFIPTCPPHQFPLQPSRNGQLPPTTPTGSTHTSCRCKDGQGQHAQHGLYPHIVSYGPPQYHTALPVQYGYLSSMGGPPP